MLRAAWLGVLLLAGCAAGPGVSPPVDERSAQASAGETVTELGRSPTAQRAGPAAAGLLAQADTAAQAGDLPGAVARVERALRIEPRNALLWHRLAAYRLAQGRYGDAEGLAAKSNSLAGDDRDLQWHNWQVIAKARSGRGDRAGAEQARRRQQALTKDR